MWPWSRTARARLDTAKLIEVNEVMLHLQEHLHAVDTRGKDLQLNFEELQDKVYRWMQRTKQRDRRDGAEVERSGAHPNPRVQAIIDRRARGTRPPEP